MNPVLREIMMMCPRSKYLPWGAATTLNPADKNAHVALSGGNLVATADSSTWIAGVRGTTSHASGMWRYQAIVGLAPTGSPQYTRAHIGVGTSAASIADGDMPGRDVSGWGYVVYESTDIGLHANAYGTSLGEFTAGDVMDVYADLNLGTIKLARNGSGLGTLFTGVSGTLFPMVSVQGGSALQYLTLNFGATPFIHPAVY